MTDPIIEFRDKLRASLAGIGAAAGARAAELGVLAISEGWSPETVSLRVEDQLKNVDTLMRECSLQMVGALREALGRVPMAVRLKAMEIGSEAELEVRLSALEASALAEVPILATAVRQTFAERLAQLRIRVAPAVRT